MRSGFADILPEQKSLRLNKERFHPARKEKHRSWGRGLYWTISVFQIFPRYFTWPVLESVIFIFNFRENNARTQFPLEVSPACAIRALLFLACLRQRSARILALHKVFNAPCEFCTWKELVNDGKLSVVLYRFEATLEQWKFPNSTRLPRKLSSFCHVGRPSWVYKLANALAYSPSDYGSSGEVISMYCVFSCGFLRKLHIEISEKHIFIIPLLHFITHKTHTLWAYRLKQQSPCCFWPCHNCKQTKRCVENNSKNIDTVSFLYFLIIFFTDISCQQYFRSLYKYTLIWDQNRCTEKKTNIQTNKTIRKKNVS